MTEMSGLTWDNLHLSDPSKAIGPALSGSDFAINCNGPASAFIAESLANSTRRAYRSDLEHFRSWGGVIPASPELLAEYLAAHADLLCTATLGRRVASLSWAHRIAQLPNPVTAELVRATLRGVKRIKGSAQRQAKPLLRDDLFLALERTGDDLKAIRDRALLLVGFAGALRRSELVGLDVTDVEQVRQGMILHLRRSKTDQEGHGQKIGVPHGRTRWCPVAALDGWLTTAQISNGPLFRPVNRHGRIQASRLSREAVAAVVKTRVAAAGIDAADYSGHSLRAGLATSAAQVGVAIWRIKAQTRHASDAMLARYIRDGELFTDNAAGALL